MPNRMWIVALAALVAGCDAGPSDSEFETACLSEGARGANKAMRREMGITGEAFCKCVTKEARTHLPAEGRQAIMLDMSGRPQEAHAITAKLSDADQAAMMKGAMTVLQTCVGMAMK